MTRALGSVTEVRKSAVVWRGGHSYPSSWKYDFALSAGPKKTHLP